MTAEKHARLADHYVAALDHEMRVVATGAARTYSEAPPLYDPARGSYVPSTERGRRKGEGKRWKGRRR